MKDCIPVHNIRSKGLDQGYTMTHSTPWNAFTLQLNPSTQMNLGFEHNYIVRNSRYSNMTLHAKHSWIRQVGSQTSNGFYQFTFSNQKSGGNIQQFPKGQKGRGGGDHRLVYAAHYPKSRRTDFWWLTNVDECKVNTYDFPDPSYDPVAHIFVYSVR